VDSAKSPLKLALTIDLNKKKNKMDKKTIISRAYAEVPAFGLT